jgi:HlyD family secretion protein
MAQSISGAIDTPKPKPSWLHFLISLGLILAGGAAAWYFLSRPQSHDLQLSGRIEGYESDIGTKVAGRIEEVTVREGASVTKGQLLAKLDDDELRAQLKGAEAKIKAAKEQQENARLQVAVIESQLTEAQLKIQQSEGDTVGRVSQATAQVAAADAQLQQAQAQVIEAEAQLELAKSDRDRYAQLSQDGAASQQRSQQASTTYKTAQATLTSRKATVAAFQRQVAAAQGQLTQSQSTRWNPDINAAQRDRFNTQLKQSQALLASAQADVTNAEATRQQIMAQLGNLTITSPINGTVTVRSVEPGVVVSPGKTLLTVLDLNTVYLRGFIPQGQIGQVHVGQAAKVFLDSAPDRPFPAKVSAIDAEASFTPENIYFKQDRVQQVFGVRLTIEQPDGLAKPGMPADAEIVLEDQGS